MALVRAEKSGGPSTGSNPGTGGAGIKAGVGGMAGSTGAGATGAGIKPVAAGWRVRPGRWRCSGVTVTGHSMPCRSAMARKNRVRMEARNSSGFLPSPRAARESMWYSADVSDNVFVAFMTLRLSNDITYVNTFFYRPIIFFEFV